MNARPAIRGRMRYDWWRAHHGLPQHGKWRSVAREAGVPVSVAFHVAVCLLDLASRSTPRGSIADFKPFDCAGVVDVPVADVERVIDILRIIHWIEGHMLTDWDERQPQREDATAAERKSRQRHASSRIQSVTPEPVTHPKRDKAQSHAIEAGQCSESANVTNVSAPDKDKIDSSFSVAAKAETSNPAGSLATAPRDGALTRPPHTLTRAELDAIIEEKRRRTAAVPFILPDIPPELDRRVKVA